MKDRTVVAFKLDPFEGLFHIHGDTIVYADSKEGEEPQKVIQMQVRPLDPEKDKEESKTGELIGSFAELLLGAKVNPGRIHVCDAAGNDAISLLGENAALNIGTNDNWGELGIRDISGQIVIYFDGKNSEMQVGETDNDGKVIVKGKAGKVIKLDGSKAELSVGVRDNIRLIADETGLLLGGQYDHGKILVQGCSGPAVQIESTEEAQGKITLFDRGTQEKGNQDAIQLNGNEAKITIGAENNPGDIFIQDGSVFENEDGSTGLQRSIAIRGKITDKNTGEEYALIRAGINDVPGRFTVRNSQNETTISLDGETGDIHLFGGDCAEAFEVIPTCELDLGSVMVIIEDEKLQESQKSYDRRVAGVLSGGGGLSPGIVLGNHKSDEGHMPIALNGKVYCKVDANYAPIEVGDLLTTSDTPGHAMKATDSKMAFGAVIGKAILPLKKGKGLIPILVALQ